MFIEIHLPDIGTDTAEVTDILVSIDDQVEVDTPLISVEGDKAAMEIPSPKSGTVSEIKTAVGDSVSTGTLILILKPNEEDLPKTEEPDNDEKKETDKPEIVSKEILLPDVGADDVTITEVHVEVGDEVQKEQAIISVEGDKAAMEIPSPHTGKIVAINIATGESISTGTSLLVMESSELPERKKTPSPSSHQNQKLNKPSTQKQVQQSISTASGFVENQEFVHASPSVRRAAREFGVNLAKVRGSGRKGRIIKEDIQNYVKEALRVLESGGGGDGLGLLPWPDIDFNQFGETESEQLTKIKKLTGANLHRNWVKIPHVTQWEDVRYRF
jgi:pyruvate dehydrogenase E2 component (dihydrolipoamide acetyltransferase)